jgi:hypothetical protein
MTISDLDHFSGFWLFGMAHEKGSSGDGMLSPRANPLFYIFHSHKKRVDGIGLGVVEGVG